VSRDVTLLLVSYSINTNSTGRRRLLVGEAPDFGLNIILPSPKVYGVRHTEGGAEGRRILRKGRVLVLQ